MPPAMLGNIVISAFLALGIGGLLPAATATAMVGRSLFSATLVLQQPAGGKRP